MLGTKQCQTVEEEFEEVFQWNFPSTEENDEDLLSAEETFEEIFQENFPQLVEEEDTPGLENIQKSENE